MTKIRYALLGSGPMILEGFFLALAVFSSILDWIALAEGWHWVDYVAKPGVIIFLIAALITISSNSGLEYFHILILIALACSLAGDIFLMLPQERFTAGLTAFTLAYLAYAAAFTPSPPPITIGAVLAALFLAILVALLLLRVLAELELSGRQKMRFPVMVFSLVIYLMVTTAVLALFRPNWPTASATVIALGGLLIFISDALLATDRFVRPIAAARLKVRVPYHTGQILITLGVVLLTSLL